MLDVKPFLRSQAEKNLASYQKRYHVFLWLSVSGLIATIITGLSVGFDVIWGLYVLMAVLIGSAVLMKRFASQ